MSALYKQQCGENLTDFIMKVRIREAKALLAKDEFSILQIAKMVGYSTDVGFIRAFKKCEGHTPGQYRNERQLKVLNASEEG